jgi:acyl carrier protein
VKPGRAGSLEIVRIALALHLDAPPETLAEGQHLEADLGLDALDLILVVLRLDELADAEFPVAELEHAQTVADLVDLVLAWRHDDEAFRDEPARPVCTARRRHDSGVRIAACAPSLGGALARRAASGGG